MKKYSYYYLLCFIMLLILNSCGKEESQNSFLDDQKIIMGGVEGTEKEWKDYLGIFEVEPETSNDVEFRLDEEIKKKSSLDIIETDDKTFVKCSITAPNLYDYMSHNIDDLMRLDEEDLYQRILTYIQSENVQMRTVEVNLRIVEEENQKFIDTDNFEYQDALLGGLNSFMTDIYVAALEDIELNLEGE